MDYNWKWFDRVHIAILSGKVYESNILLWWRAEAQIYLSADGMKIWVFDLFAIMLRFPINDVYDEARKSLLQGFS